MFCDEFLEHVDAIASGDLPLDARATAHVATCAGCSDALASAERVEHLLKKRPALPAPPQFTARIMSRIRGDRWRREQFLDIGFNVAIGAVLLAAIVGAWMLLSQSGIGGVVADGLTLARAIARGAFDRVAPSLPLYLGAFGALASALAIWWWAEQKTEI